MNWIDGFIFSSPTLIARCLWEMGADGSLFWHTGVTLLETLASFAICTVLSLACALALWSSKSAAQILEPFLVLLNSLPKSALAPLLIVWLGNNMRTIITAAVSVAVFGSILTLYTGFVQMDPEKIKLIRSLGGGQRDILFKVLLPGSLPLVINSMKVNIGLCLVGVIIGEFLSAPGRPGLPHHLWFPDLCHDYGSDRHCGAVHSLHPALSVRRILGEADAVRAASGRQRKPIH